MIVVDIAAAGVRLATPVVLASAGETISQRAGVVNVQLEGMMLVGAFTGVLGAHYSGDASVGLVAAVAGGLLVALVHGLISITFGGDQIVSGIGLNLLALGATSYLLDAFFGGVRVTAPGLDEIEIPGLADIPWIGEIFFSQSAGVYLMYGLLPILAFSLYKTPWGLRVIACGENPSAADTVGVNVNRTRYQGLVVAGAMAGLGGGILALSQLRFFVDNMTQGRGFIALAAVLFGNWMLWRVVLAATFFEVMEALQLRLQAIGVGLPPEALQMLPYVLTVAVLAGLIGRSRPPARFAIPYIRGETR